MKFSYILLINILLLLSGSAFAQQISGKLVDENGDGLYEVNVKIHLGQNNYEAITDIDGNFSFDGITNVDDDVLPQGYSVSDNYPNPFNPKTRLNVNLPADGNVKIIIYNLLGEQVADKIQKQLSAGTNFLDIELNGLSNGIYIARIVIDEKYSVTKKLMLIYGTQHLNSSELSNLNFTQPHLSKSNTANLQIDSLVAFNPIIGRKVFTSLPPYVGQVLDLGSFEIARYCPDMPTINYEGKMYNTVLIGEQCWLKENLDVGIIVSGSSDMSNNGIVEKYCYGNDTINCNEYGALYQWDEVMQYTNQEGAKGICPDGWHVPTKAELEILKVTLNSDGNALKGIGQGSGSAAGTNSSGFSALLSGSRGFLSNFGGIAERTNFWSSFLTDSLNVQNLYLSNTNNSIFLISTNKESGFSVRCISGEGAMVNNPPLIPNSPNPQNDSTDVFLSADLSWNCEDPDGDALTYDIYFGVDPNPSLAVSGHDTTSYDPGILDETTTYYWKIAANDGQVSTEGPVWSFTTSNGEGEPCPEIPTILYAGKLYNTVKIGSQCWIKENLDVGEMIIGTLNMTDNDTIEKYCYNNDPLNCDSLGALYQWNEAMQYTALQDSQGICPEGWHIPTMAEFDTLTAAVANDGNALKAIGEGTGAGAGTNTSGFSALLAGDRRADGSFLDLNDYTNFWSSVESNSANANYIYLSKTNADIGKFNFNKDYGFSVRCVKN